MNKRYQVFISSTYTDLLSERQAAVEAILKTGHIPAGMELFAAGDQSQMETIKRWIDASDIYMLILGGRYGSVEPKTGVSYIELEYDYAVSLGKPVFAVVITDKALDGKVRERGKEVLETDRPKEYKAFREKVLGKTSSFFDDSKDIKLAVHESLSDIPNRYDLVGWICAADVPDAKSLLTEIERLSQEKECLQEENANLQKQLQGRAKGKPKEQEFKDIIGLLKKIEVESTLFDSSEQGKPTRVRLLNVFYAMRDRLVTGVTNQYGIDDLDQLLYFNVCPKLQIHGLMVNEKVASARYRRFSLTRKGQEVLAYIDRKRLLKEKPEGGAAEVEKSPKKKASRKSTGKSQSQQPPAQRRR